jgi:hypothetical protein
MTDSVDWIENRLEVTGPDKDLQEFVIAAEGPGIVLWERPAGEDLAYWSALLLQGGAPSPRAAARLARRYEDKLWSKIESARTSAERGMMVVPLDLNSFAPVPRKIVRKGWHAAGSDWCWEHWGTRWPLRKVGFRFEHRRRRGSSGIEVAAVYEFLSGDWSPWKIVRKVRDSWPGLRVELIPYYDAVHQIGSNSEQLSAA